MLRHYLAGISRSRAPAWRRVDVEFHAALTGRFKIVGVDLDLIG
jgi:hypothetical protein